jgi:mRNA-degrading endonuclease toxin of MazEF toxin-antitoxin module
MERVIQSEVVWVALPEPAGSRPAVVLQGDAHNASALPTTIIVPLTTNERLAAMPGNVRLTPRQSGLRRTSIANVTQLQVIPKASITRRVGHLSAAKMRELWAGINLVFGSPYSLD